MPRTDAPSIRCPHCGAPDSSRSAAGWNCGSCGREWRPRIFESYGRLDASELAERLKTDLEHHGFEVWHDTHRIPAGAAWPAEIQRGLDGSHAVVALLSPHAVRVTTDTANLDGLDSVCLDEISYARCSRPPKPIVPVMAVPCQPPLLIYRLDYVDLTDWHQSEAAYQSGFGRLVNALEAALYGQVRYRRWEEQLLPWDFTVFLEEKRVGFCGREWLFEEIENWRRTGRDGALLITGDPGSGKSAIVAELVRRNPDGQILAYHCCQADVPATLEPGRFIRSIAAMLASQLPDYALALDDPGIREVLTPAYSDEDPASAFEVAIVTTLARIPPPSATRYILIDALDEALIQSQRGLTIVDLLAPRLERLPAWLRLVATTRPERPVLSRLRGLRARILDAHDTRNLEDVRRYIQLRLDSPAIAADVARSRLPPIELTRLVEEKSDGNFLCAQQILRAVEHGDCDFDSLAVLPPGLGGCYQRFFSRQFPDESAYDPSRKVLECVMVARERLNEQQLSEITGLERRELQSALAHLSSYLRATEGGYGLFHASLNVWLTDATLGSPQHLVDLNRGQQMMLEYCRRWRDVDDAYPLRHLPAHLAAMRRMNELKELLLGTDFLHQKAARLGEPFFAVQDLGYLEPFLHPETQDQDVSRAMDSAFVRFGERRALVPYLYQFWKEHREAGWHMLERLTAGAVGKFGWPNADALETAASMASGIVNYHFDDDEIMARLHQLWRPLVNRFFRSPVMRLFRRPLLSRANESVQETLRSVVDYPFNAKEIARADSRRDETRSNALAMLNVLADPRLGIAPVVDILRRPDLQFDLYLMLISERVLVYHGSLDRAGVLAALKQLHGEGCSWFRSSALSIAFHTLDTATTLRDEWLQDYSQMLQETIMSTRATLSTDIGVYPLTDELACAELLFERRTPSDTCRFVPHLLTHARQLGDRDYTHRVVAACELLGVRYRRYGRSVRALISALAVHPDLRVDVVRTLSNVRVGDEPLVDRLLAESGDQTLGREVKASAPSVKDAHFHWSSHLLTYWLIHSDAYRRAEIDLWKRVLASRSMPESVACVLTSAVNHLAGTQVLAWK